MSTTSHVNAPVNYLDIDNVQEKPAYYLYTPPAGVPQRNAAPIKHTMPIHNAREHIDEISLDKQGITFTRHETAVKNFYDAEEVKAVYYPEVVELVKKITGAEKVHVFDHNVRCAPMCERGENGAREPVKFAHNDYTLKSGPQRVRDLLPTAEAEERLKHRFAVVNVWRPIRGPVQDTPLAVCDADSMTQEILRKPISNTKIEPVRSIQSHIVPIIVGFISRIWNATKPCCSSATTRRRMDGHVSLPIQHLKTRHPHRMRPPARALKHGHWCSFHLKRSPYS